MRYNPYNIFEIDEVIQYLEDYKSLLTKGELEVF